MEENIGLMAVHRVDVWRFFFHPSICETSHVTKVGQPVRNGVSLGTLFTFPHAIERNDTFHATRVAFIKALD